MDSRIGLDYIVENSDYVTKLGAGKATTPIGPCLEETLEFL